MHDDCPLGGGGYTAIMTKLEHLETLVKATQDSNERRIASLESITGRQLFIGGLISAVTAGFVMAFKFAISGGDK